MKTGLSILLAIFLLDAHVFAGERIILSLRDFTQTELKGTGIAITQPTTVHIVALGGGEGGGWGGKSNNLFAYGWIINAESKEIVWEMTGENTSSSSDDRKFDGTINLSPGKYEVYFTAYAFAEHSAFSQIQMNIDHRNSPLFGNPSESKHDFFGWFKDLWSGDAKRDFYKRAPHWGIDLLVDESVAESMTQFTPPLGLPDVVSRAIGLGDNRCVRIAFELRDRTTLRLYALGERGRENELPDGGWIVNLADRKRVWSMSDEDLAYAGGTSKNIEFHGDITLDRGRYLLYYITDNSHSMDDWNQAPPYDPLDYGINISIPDESERANFNQIPYDDYDNVIVSLVRVGDNEHRTDGFSLKQEADLRVYAIGERSGGRRSMADFGQIIDARTRVRVWTMDAERTDYAGGAPKNRYIDEIIHLPKGNYEVSYTTDDSHSYDEWNDDPPFDPSHYGITVMGVGPKFSPSIVGKYVEERDKSIIAQIIRPGDNENRTVHFRLDKPMRIRIYAIGEGMGRDMFDYGWIEDARSGDRVWEMTYPMTFYAGGARKNRMVNTTLTLERGEYTLHWKSDDSHSYNDWNSDPPDDQDYWGITVFRDAGEDFAPKAIVPPEPEEPTVPSAPEAPRHRIPPPPKPPQD
ncbi:MAG TPA: hypothetical protein VMG09_14380 [Bacteroidota bacterium]|nr:hypothetical protein [Bacteroidota bacterium]